MVKLAQPYLEYALNERTRIYLVRADIVDVGVNIIVSSDNTRLSMTAGVGESIRRKSGDAVLERFDPATRQPLASTESVGFAKVYESPPGNLSADRMFHVAVVDWDHRIATTPEVVRAAASACFRWTRHYAAERPDGMSIALPLMGSGAGRLTFAESLEAIVGAARDSLMASAEPIDIIICIAPGGPFPESLRKRLEALLDTFRDTGPLDRPSLMPPRADARKTAPTKVAQRPSTLADAVALSESALAQLPAPIAYSLSAALNQSSPAEQFRLSLEMAESLVRFLAYCCLASELPNDPHARGAAVAAALKSKPSLGDWVDALRSRMETLRSISEPTCDLLQAQKGKRPPGGKFLLEDLAHTRNTYIGHGRSLPEGAYAALLLEITEPLGKFVKSFSEVWPFQLVVPVDFDWGPDGTVIYVTRSLRGPYAVFPTEISSTPLRLAKKHVFLCCPDPGGAAQGYWLDLDPMVKFAVCPACQKDDIFFADGASGGELVMSSVFNAHHLSVPI